MNIFNTNHFQKEKYYEIVTNVLAFSEIFFSFKLKHTNPIRPTTNSYSQTTALLQQKGCTLDFAMAIGGILEFAVPLLLKSHIFYY